MNEDQTVLGSDLYAEMMHLWQTKFEISFVEADVRDDGPEASLFAIWQKNESRFNDDDEWRQLANWAFYNAASLKVRNAYGRGVRVFSVGKAACRSRILTSR